MGTLTHENIVPTKNKYIFGPITRDPKLIRQVTRVFFDQLEPQWFLLRIRSRSWAW